MDKIIEFKNMVCAIFNVIANDDKEQIDNLLIAQLNDVSYKAIRKKGVQKQLDARAIKNETLFKKLDQQLETSVSQMDFDKLAQTHKALLESLGQCPLSMNDALELIQNRDCMCLGLEIARSQATISDPSKLVIRNVYPVFMSLDSFLESSIYHLKLNQDASGGFDLKNQAKLAIGAGRESISGILPLYLFKEHWDVARRKIQPVYGFMCTLDPLGYAAA